MIDKKQYLTTGEFAKMMNITKDTLFHYDKIGLFSPEIKLENEYRYYSINQIELLDVILLLKDLGMPLKEIKEFMDKRNGSSLMELFEKEEAEIDAKIRRLKEQKRIIKEQKNHLHAIEGKTFDKIEVQSFCERYYIIGRAELQEDKELYHEVAYLKEKCEKAKVKRGYTIGFIQYKKEIQKEQYNNYWDVTLIMKTPPKGLTYHILPQGDYVVAYHKGHWKNIGETYAKMMSYIDSHQLEVEDMFLEVYVIDRLLVDDYNDYVTEISVKIKEEAPNACHT